MNSFFLGVSCKTLLERFGCHCEEATTASPNAIQDPLTDIRFWCLNAEHPDLYGYDDNGNNKLNLLFDALEDKDFYRTTIEANVLGGAFNSSKAIAVPNIIVLAIRNSTL